MRTLMLIASLAMIASGIFCVANSSAAFVSLAFIIGTVFLVLGICEIIVGRRADFESAENAVGLTKDGIRSIIVGLVIISGQVSDDFAAQMIFGIYLAFEGVYSFRTDWINVARVPKEQRADMTLSAVMLVLGIYTLFNTSVFKFPAALLIGIGLILAGLRRFSQSSTIEYIRPSFITGNEEKLREAQEEEKRALAKAKEGIREQKIAQRRIRKIEEDIEAEQELIKEAHIRKEERALEESSNE